MKKSGCWKNVRREEKGLGRPRRAGRKANGESKQKRNKKAPAISELKGKSATEKNGNHLPQVRGLTEDRKQAGDHACRKWETK